MGDPLEGCNLSQGHHQVGQADTGEQQFAEGARIQHPPMAIQAGKRRERAADIAVLAVVVVLHDPGPGAGGPVQQQLPSRQRQGHGQGALMARCDHGDLRRPGVGDSLLDIHALGIHCHPLQFKPELAQYLARDRITRVFNPGTLAVAQQRLRHQRQAAAPTAGDEHLLGRASDAARHLQVRGNRAAQCWQPEGRRVVQVTRLHPAQVASTQARPDLAREGIHRWQAQLKWQKLWRALQGVRVLGTITGRGLYCRRGCGRAQLRVDHGAFLLKGQQVALTGEQRIGKLDGATCHPQLLGHGPRRRQAVTRRQGVCCYRGEHTVVELPVERRGGALIERCEGWRRKGHHGLVHIPFLGSFKWVERGSS